MTKGQFLQKEYTLPRGNLTRSWSLLAVAVLLGVLCSTSLSLAARDQSYQALRHWLERYRTAEPAFKPGEHLTFKDREALKPFIPQPAWEYYFFSGMDMEIAPTGHYPLPPGWGKEVKPGYHLNERGILVGFTGGGFPFPEIKSEDPQAAVKVIWNLLWRPGAKDYVMPMVTWSRGEGGRLDRELQFIETSARYARGDHCLVPGYGEVWNKTLLELRAPRDLAGTKRLIINYLDHYQEDDGWIYMPSQRKPRRVLASERTDEFPGMDNVPEDLWGFDGKVYEHHWTYLGKKAVLATINVRDNPEAGGPHLWVPDKARWEVRECHVLLANSKRSNHPYSHKVLFVDAEHFWALWTLAFDRNEKFLRFSQDFLRYSESYAAEPPRQAPYMQQDFSQNLGHHVFIHLGSAYINVQKPHASYTHCYVMLKDFSPGRAKQFFSVRNMVGGRR